jgi:Cation transporter/ATPase, N-terminus
MNNASGGAFWQTPLEELKRQLGASSNGLSSTEAAARLLRYGANTLDSRQKCRKLASGGGSLSRRGR